MEVIDQAFKKLLTLLKEYDVQGLEAKSEAELRFQFLDRVLLEVLGWKHADIHVETASESGYSDYLLNIGSNNAAVIEAKRSSDELVETVKSSKSAYLLGGSVLKLAMPGINQARSYASDHGCGLAAVTNGITWIAFRDRRDGLPFLKGHAIVFPTLSSIRDGFASFYDVFSREGIAEYRYLIHLSKAEGTLVSTNIDWFKAVDDRRNTLMPLSPLSADLDRVFEGFFRSIVDESDRQMLVDCFVESRESHDTDLTLRKLTEELIADIAALSTATGEELRKEIEETIRAQISEIVLIVGQKGSGKSTFVDRFYAVVLPKAIRKQCLVMRANLADATQEESTVESWLTETLICEAEKTLFNQGIPGYEDLQGMYFSEYQAWQIGEYKYLYEKDKSDFKIKFGEFMSGQRKADRLSYLQRLLRTANRQRSLLPCIIFDNTDQFPQAFQERVFQYAYALYRAVIAFLIVPITDRTIWQLSKAGPLQSYPTKAFFLPVPSTKEILEKRVAYLRKKAQEARKGGSYFLSRGIRLTLDNIIGFAATVEEVFIKRGFIAKRVAWLSNNDLRRGLELTRRIVTAPALRADELVTAYVAGYSTSITDTRVTLAIIQDRHRYFDQETNSFIQNMFEVPTDHLTSPFIKVSLLRVLLDALGKARDDQRDQYLEIARLIELVTAPSF
jgi:energy-coupling factor transporter ATP-binding protein EcfA2